jgi:hypothetical protein
MRAVIVAISLSACVLVTGCGKSSEKTIVIPGKDGNVTVSGSGDTEHMTVKSADGTATFDVNANGGVHASMPDFAPLYPGAIVTSSMAGNNANGAKSAQVIFAVSAAPSDVIAFYKQKSDAAGLVQSVNATVNDTVMFEASKDKKSILVTASKGSKGTQVSITWGSDK